MIPVYTFYLFNLVFMKHVKNYSVLGATALLFLGAGCANTPVQPEAKPVNEAVPVSAPAVSVETTITAPATNELSLTGEAKGNMLVHLSFTTPAEMDKDVQGFRLLMGREENPTPQTATDWYDLGSAHRSKDWTVNAIGSRHFRVCTLIKNQCQTFSNNLELDVK